MVGYGLSLLIQSLLIQSSLMAGIAGLLWPEKFIPVFEILMFPWTPNNRMVRLNSVGAILMSALLFVELWLKSR